MIFKAKAVSDVVIPLQLVDGDGFTVSVNHLTNKQQEDLYNATTDVRIDRTGEKVRRVNSGRWRQLAPDAYISGWEGLTPETFPKLGIVLEEPPPVDGAGEVPYSPEAARELWSLADALQFSQRIMECSREAAAMAAEAERLRKKNSSASSDELKE